jgi:hypothetical protein
VSQIVRSDRLDPGPLYSVCEPPARRLRPRQIAPVGAHHRPSSTRAYERSFEEDSQSDRSYAPMTIDHLSDNADPAAPITSNARNRATPR